MQLSRFFTLAELTRSDTAAREGIPNEPPAEQTDALRALCSAVLDPLREAVGRPVRITSGYRGPALNARIGGSATSQHSQCQAADLQVPGLAVLEIFKTVVRMGLPYDQVIYEAQSATVKWVHVSHRASGNRGEIRIAQFNAAGKPTGYPLVSKDQALAMSDGPASLTRGKSADPGYVERADEPTFEDVPAAAARKAPARKPATKKPAIKKPATKKAAAKKAPAKKAPAKKAAAKSGALASSKK